MKKWIALLLLLLLLPAAALGEEGYTVTEREKEVLQAPPRLVTAQDVRKQVAAVERQDACIAMFQDAVEARRAGRSAEADALTALIEMNADPAQIAEFAAWLEHRNAQQSPTAL